MTLAQDLRTLFEIDRHPLRPIAMDRHVDGGIVTETLSFKTASGEPVRGFLTRPKSVDQPLPAILYIHAHGGAYEIGARELIAGRKALLSPLGPVFAKAGFVTLCIDLPTFGNRANQSESAVSKARLWQGGSLAGQMLGELAASLGYLAARPDVDPTCLGAFGISMGATFSYWLAAVDPRLTCVAHLCCYADFATLIETGAHDLHGIYLTVPGLLNLASNGTIAGLVAPRPQLICIGEADPLTPPLAVDRALVQTRAAYAAANAPEALELHRQATAGHEETPEMRARILDFFARTLHA